MLSLLDIETDLAGLAARTVAVQAPAPAPAVPEVVAEEVEAVEVVDEYDRAGRLYPNSFQTADLKHVVDNALSEVLESMTHVCPGLAYQKAKS